MDSSAALTAKAGDLGIVRGSVRSLPGARRVRRGVYCVDPAREPSFEESVVAALLVLPTGSVACGLTAARLWRLDALVPVQPDEPFEFAVLGGLNSAKLQGCQLHFVGMTTVGLPLGIPATSVSRTVIDLVARLTFIDGVALTEAVLRADPEFSHELTLERGRRLPPKGAQRVQRVLDFAGWLSESVLESHARVLWHEAGLPAPVQQAVILRDGRFFARVDFLWKSARLIVEVDGLSKYREPGELQREKARQNALVALRYTVLRFTWADITHRPDAVVRQIRAALRQAS